MKMPSQFFKIFSLTLGLFCAVPAAANNISITNTTLADQDTGADTYDIQFDISWDNSWFVPDSLLEPGYWDAAWVFAKYAVYNQASSTWGPWQHCELLNTGAVEPAGSQIDFGDTDGAFVGAFIYRNADGTGSNNWDGASLRWHYGADSVADNAIVRVKVFGLEMVYIPEGAFYVGDGTTSSVAGHFHVGGTTTTAFEITGEGELTLGGTAPANLANNNASGMMIGDDFNNGTTQTLPAAFPKGFNPFYIMKYDITQKQYVDFLNTLTGTQQATRASATTAGNFHQNNNTTNTPTNRGGIKCSIAPVGATPGVYVNDLNNNDVDNEVDDGQTLSVNWLSWADGASYSAWAGLRPFTELEFEKAARGPLSPVVDEYAWGTATIAGSAYTLSNSGAANEGIATNYSTTVGNAAYNTTTDVVGIQGPLRAGIFAGHTNNSGRTTSGGSYYGVMELSGNVWKRPVSVGRATGRAFTGSHGSGTLNASGNFTNGDWPEISANGSGGRGGPWADSATYLRVSNRSHGVVWGEARDFNTGGRAARTAP